jgi:hypothetical protein
MLNGNGWATSSEIAAASLLLDLEIDVQQIPGQKEL